MSITKETVKTRATMWLRARGLTQGWLAHELGVSPAYVWMILNGKRTPSLSIAKQLQDITGIAATEFDSPPSARSRVA